MQLTKNFTLEEFAASDTAKAKGINNAIPSNVIPAITNLCGKLLQPIRDIYGQPITIGSGYRCPELNKAVGGVPTSQHTKGEAADCHCANPKKLLEILKSSRLDFDQAILYPTFLHLSLKASGYNRKQVILK